MGWCYWIAPLSLDPSATLTGGEGRPRPVLITF